MTTTRIFKRGMKDPYVAKIQRALNEIQRLQLKPDGDFGPATENALKDWQGANKFPKTGIFHENTAAVLGAYIERRYITEQDYVDSAARLKVELACVKAVQEVESKGAGFLNDGRTIILFERHVFRRELNKAMQSDNALVRRLLTKLGLQPQPGQQFIPLIQEHLQRTQPDIYNSASGGYLGNEREYDKLARAMLLDPACAQMSASWGLYQIMGYHFKGMGFKTIDEMVKFYSVSEKNQQKSFTDFILSPIDPRLLPALRAKDWLAFARAYNGPAQKGYDVRMAAAYRKHSMA